jgi:hypothetical protein
VIVPGFCQVLLAEFIMAPSALVRFACLLLVLGALGCSKSSNNGHVDFVSFGETKSTAGQTVRIETHDSDLLETRFESDSTVFRFHSGDLKVSAANITYRGQDLLTLPKTWKSIKLSKSNGLVTINVDSQQVATAKLAS